LDVVDCHLVSVQLVSQLVKTALKVLYVLPVVAALGVCGYLMSNRSKTPALHVMSGSPFATLAVTNLTARLFTAGGHLDAAGSDVFIEFRDAAGAPVEVGEVRFELGMISPNSITHNLFKVLPTSTPGQYRVNVVPQIAGDWNAKLSIAGPRGKAEAAFLVTVK
jgi:hypothetical protein